MNDRIEEVPLFEVGESYEEWADLVVAEGWGDGLPLVPPTRERVAAMIQTSGLERRAEIGLVPPAWRSALVEDLAINGVMAGLPPRCFRLVVEAFTAMLEPAFNLYALQATTNPVAPAVVIDGPIAEECGIASGYGCLGPGWAANATIGRALRLCMMHIGGARPGELDRATHGQPAKWTLAFAEREDRCPWGTLAASRGVEEGGSAITVIGVCCLVNHLDNTSTSADELLAGLAKTMSYYGSNTLHSGGEMLLILSPEHAEIIARSISTRSELQRELYDRAVVSRSEFASNAMKHMMRRRSRHPEAIEGEWVHVLDGPAELLVVVAGGDGLHSMLGPSLGPTRAVTKHMR